MSVSRQESLAWERAVGLAEDTDLDGLTDPGFYDVDQPLSSPDDTKTYHILVLAPSNYVRPHGVIQTAWRKDTGDQYFRVNIQGAWTVWSLRGGSGGSAGAAVDVSFAPIGGIASTNVQDAIQEVDSEKLDAASYTAADVLAKLLTVDGSLSGLDADTLDGQHGAYYLPASSYTAADVLAKLLTVDGALSGLDADTVDGQHASAFAAAGHVHAAADITFSAVGGLDAASVQGALAELDSEKLAAASYTAADVLAKLLTVDGSLSGLDADLLDGNHASAFATAGHVHAATAVTFATTSDLVSTNVNAAIEEVYAAIGVGGGTAAGTSFSPIGNIIATNVQAAIEELDAEKLAAASYTAADVLSKLLTVDGTTSGLDADLLDGNHASAFATATALSDHIADITAAHAASAISYGGSAGIAATNVEGALDELDTEKLAAASYTAADVLAKLLTVDGNTSGLDADLLDGHDSGDFAQLAAGNTFVTSQTIGLAADAATRRLIVRAAAGQERGVLLQSGALARWNIRANSTGETGADVGTDLQVVSYDDAGNALDIILTAIRSTGVVSFLNPPTVGAQAIWYAGNDGAGSGLDADTLDGVQGSGYSLSGHTHTAANVTDFTEAAQDVIGALLVDSAEIDYTYNDAGNAETIAIKANSVGVGKLTATATSRVFGRITAAAGAGEELTPANLITLLAAADGAGSGLDADTLDGQQGAYYLPASSYTAADVLAKLLTVDGVGSGINADFLDNLSSAAFAQLSAANSFSAAQTITITTSSSALSLISTDSGATRGPDLFLHRASSTPAANDEGPGVMFSGKDTAAANTNYALIRSVILDPTDGSEDGALDLIPKIVGVLTNVLRLHDGVYAPTATGGAKGAGTINMTELYNDGALVGACALLAQASVAGAAATFNVSGDWSSYRRLLVVVANLSHDSGSNQTFSMSFSDDSGSTFETINYGYMRNANGTMGGAAGSSASLPIITVGISGGAACAGIATVDFQSQTNISKLIHMENFAYAGGTEENISLSGLTSSGTVNPINYIRVTASAGNVDGGVIWVFGLGQV